MLMRLLAVAALAFAFSAAAEETPAPPADPLPLLDEAKTAVTSGEFAHARRAAEAAAKAIVVKEGEIVRGFLPAPFDGWTMSDGEVSSLGMLAVDAGLTVDRSYSGSDGQQVRIEILADSSVVEQMAAMYTDPAMLAASGAKTEIINGETAMIDPSSGQITVLLGTRTSVTLSGSPADIVKSYAQNVNFAGLKDMK